MKASEDSTPQPPQYSAVPPATSTAPYPVKPGAPTGTVATGYPPPPGYPHSGVPVSNVIGEYPVHAAGTVITPPLTVGPESCTTVCPACHKTVQTDVKVVSTTRTHTFALLLAMFGMKGSQDSRPQPPPYSAVPPGNTTAPYPVQPGAPSGYPAPPGHPGYPAPPAHPGYPAPPGHPHSGVPVSNVIGGYPAHAGVYKYLYVSLNI
ncbi:basic proline-rich protein-like [Schistocerca piceifrons]|uniref:basic proline-rich protein-like n=1 Tax=Schistocerca piceifrons TaxID=274613 RepID=UPI001F5E57CA|nr:basic proline-rich protein-like [Schistocerca piceifrons]